MQTPAVNSITPMYSRTYVVATYITDDRRTLFYKITGTDWVAL